MPTVLLVIGASTKEMARVEYTVETAATKGDLVRLVGKMMKNGWEPRGGVSIDIHEENARFLQAMVRAIRAKDE